MTNTEYKRRLDELIFTCGMNCRYHQILKQRFGRWDRGIRIAVGVLAIAGLVVAFPETVPATMGLTVAVLALAVAVVLNIIPVGDWSRDHAELFRLWSDLRRDAVLEEHETCEAEEDKEAAPFRFRRLCELDGKAEALHAAEPAPHRHLLDRCYGDELESVWGKGIRTPEQAEERRVQIHLTPLVSGAAGAARREPASGAGVEG